MQNKNGPKILLFISLISACVYAGESTKSLKQRECHALLAGLAGSAEALSISQSGSGTARYFMRHHSVLWNAMNAFAQELPSLVKETGDAQLESKINTLIELIQAESFEGNGEVQYWIDRTLSAEKTYKNVAKQLRALANEAGNSVKQVEMTEPIQFDDSVLLQHLKGLEAGVKGISSTQQNDVDTINVWLKNWELNRDLGQAYKHTLEGSLGQILDSEIKAQVEEIINYLPKAWPDNGSGHLSDWINRVSTQEAVFEAVKHMMRTILIKWQSKLSQMETPNGFFIPGNEVLEHSSQKILKVHSLQPRLNRLLIEGKNGELNSYSYEKYSPSVREISLPDPTVGSDSKTVSFRVNDIIANDPSENRAVITHIFLNGRARVIDADQNEQFVELKSWTNLSLTNREIQTQILTKMVPIWLTLKSRLKTDLEPEAVQIENELDSLTMKIKDSSEHKIDEWKQIRSDTKFFLELHPTLPSELTHEIEQAFGFSSSQKSPGTLSHLFYHSSLDQLLPDLQLKIIDPVRSAFEEKIKTSGGPRINRLKDLLTWLDYPDLAQTQAGSRISNDSLDSPTWRGSRDTLDRVGKILLYDYPELPREIRQNIPFFLRQPNSEIFNLANAEVTFSPESLLPSPELRKLHEEVVVPLIKQIGNTYFGNNYPRNTRTQRLGTVLNAMSTFEGTEEFTGIEAPKLALDKIVGILKTEFSDIQPRLLTEVESLMREPYQTETQNLASEKSFPTLPLEFDEQTLRKMHLLKEFQKEWEDLLVKVNTADSRTQDLLLRLEKMAKAAAIPDTELTPPGQITHSEFYSQMAQSIIRDFPDLPTLMRTNLFELSEKRGTDLREIAYALPRNPPSSALFPSDLRTLTNETFNPKLIESGLSTAYFKFTTGLVLRDSLITPVIALTKSASNDWITVSSADFNELLHFANQIDVYSMTSSSLFYSLSPSPLLGKSKLTDSKPLRSKAKLKNTVLIPPKFKSEISHLDPISQRKKLREFILNSVN